MGYRDPEVRKIKDLEYRNRKKLENPDYYKNIQKSYYYRHQERILERNKEYRDTNIEACRERVSNCSKTVRGRALRAQRQSTRNRRLGIQVPSWVDKNKLKEVYLNCPEGHEVDHIIPLQGNLVSGLHVPENLQYLRISENRRKHNTFIMEKYNNE